MSALGQLLDRLRRSRPPPGSAAGIIAVPSPGDELAHEVSFLFAQLDEIESEGELIRSEARRKAAETEAAAARERRALLAQTDAEIELVTSRLVARARTDSERRARAISQQAEREAGHVLAHGRERIPAVVRLIIDRVLEE